MKGNWQRDPKRSVSESIAALDGSDLWNEKVERRLCEQARREKLARGEKTGGLQGVRYHDMETSEAIGTKRREVVRKKARELAESEIELQELYQASDSLINWEKVAALCNEIDSLGITWTEAETIEDDHDAKLCELKRQLKDIGVDWRKKAHLESLLEEFLHAQYRFAPERGWDDILESTRNYLNSPQVHTPWLTHFFLVRLIYLLKYPFERLYDEAADAAWKKQIVIVGGVLFLTICVRWLAEGFRLWSPRFSWVIGALWVIWAFYQARRYILAERQLRRLRPIYQEVEQQMFDPEETANRLRNVEAGGVYVPSLIYTLLRLKQA